MPRPGWMRDLRPWMHHARCVLPPWMQVALTDAYRPSWRQVPPGLRSAQCARSQAGCVICSQPDAWQGPILVPASTGGACIQQCWTSTPYEDQDFGFMHPGWMRMQPGACMRPSGLSPSTRQG
jgi:hypothetical protein